jgi:hypothetical protein
MQIHGMPWICISDDLFFDANPRHAVDLHRKGSKCLIGYEPMSKLRNNTIRVLCVANWINNPVQFHGMPWNCIEKHIHHILLIGSKGHQGNDDG